MVIATRTLSQLDLRSLPRAGVRGRLYPVLAVLMGKPPHVVGHAPDLAEAKRLGHALRLDFTQAFNGVQKGTGRKFIALRP